MSLVDCTTRNRTRPSLANTFAGSWRPCVMRGHGIVAGGMDPGVGGAVAGERRGGKVEDKVVGLVHVALDPACPWDGTEGWSHVNGPSCGSLAASGMPGRAPSAAPCCASCVAKSTQPWLSSA